MHLENYTTIFRKLKVSFTLLGFCMGMLAFAFTQPEAGFGMQKEKEQQSGVYKYITTNGNGNLLISMEVRNATLVEALEQLAEKANVGLAIQAEHVPEKMITTNLRGATVFHALDKLLQGTSLEAVLPSSRDVIIIKKKPDRLKKFIIQTVSGFVTDASTGEALPGVNVIIKGTTQGVSTNAEGEYELEVPSLQDTLIYSFIGYQTQEIPINGRTQIDVELQSQAITGEDMVVIGYGTQRKRDLTGSVGQVDQEAFLLNSPTNIQQGLAGRVAGVNVSQNSGRPGGRSTIRIRGNATVTSNNEPLYVVDGVVLPVVQLENGASPIDFLDPSNIESIEVLKDASATAIYGSRGANGVVLVTTTTPAERRNVVTYNSSFNLGKLPKKLDVLNSEEFIRVEEIAFQNAEKFGLASSAVDPATRIANLPMLFDSEGNPRFDTDWQDEGFRTAVSQNHSLSYSGGDSNNSYTLNLGFRNQEGIILKSSLKRFTGGLNLDSQVNNWLTVGGNINVNVQQSSQPRRVGNGGITPPRSILQSLPIIPVKFSDGSFGRNEDYPGAEGGAQPVRLVNETRRIQDVTNILGNAFANIQLSDNLEIKSTIGVNNIEQDVNFAAADDLRFISTNGEATIMEQRHRTWQINTVLTYETNVGDNDTFTGVVGTAFEKEDVFASFAGSENFPDDFFKFNNLGVASNTLTPSSDATANTLSSYFGRLNYTLNNKYLFTFTTRLDGSSRFGSGNKYGVFPSGAIGWRVSEEKFLQNVSSLSNLKLRASYGKTGNNEIPSFRNVTGLGNASFIFNDQRVSGIGVETFANPDLQWEKNKQFDFGIELGLFDDRVTFEWDLYYSKTTDMLLNAPVPTSTGFNSVVRNIGSMRNKGIEITLSTVNISTSEFRWSTDFNITANRNEVLELAGGQDIVQGGNPVTGNRIIREGEPVNSFFGFVNLGTWNTDQAAEAAKFNRLPGDVRFKDVNSDGVINDEDRVILGSGEPDEFGSLVNNFRYKNFDLTFDLQFWLGNQVAFSSRATSLDRTGITNVFSEALNNAWTPNNQDTPIPQIRPTAGFRDRESSSSRIFDGKFLRGRNLTIGYTVPTNQIQKLSSLRNLRIYYSMKNFFRITSYPGYDPEVSTFTGNFAQGTDLYSFPKPITFEFGISLNL